MNAEMLITKLEDIIERARKGEVTGIALTVTLKPDDFDVFFGGDDTLKLLGATTFLQSRVGEIAYATILPQT